MFPFDSPQHDGKFCGDLRPYSISNMVFEAFDDSDIAPDLIKGLLGPRPTIYTVIYAIPSCKEIHPES